VAGAYKHLQTSAAGVAGMASSLEPALQLTDKR
jgi:hypothetical protein